MVWGVEDKSHSIVGTKFSPLKDKKGNEELESWLLRQLTPKVEFRFFETQLDGKRVVLLEINRAPQQPVQFEGREFIRVGSYKKKLKDYPEKARELWRIFDQTPFEDGIAAERVSDEQVVKLLDYSSYFDLLNLPAPEGRKSILESLSRDGLIKRSDAGRLENHQPWRCPLCEAVG